VICSLPPSHEGLLAQWQKQIARVHAGPVTFGPFARALERHYGCTREQVAFWDVHEHADREHSAIGDHVVIRLATTPALQADVRRAVSRSLELWWRFFDGIATAVAAC
jgi:pyrroloquinoline quinone (PQQ) biosynthesis protein C